MVSRKPVVHRGGRNEQLPAGETLDKAALTEALQLALTGLVTNDASAITGATTALQAFGRLQAQANNKVDKLAEHSLVSNAERVKLANIADQATKNLNDAYLLNRANHTGVQEISTISGLQAALDNKLNKSGGAISGQLSIGLGTSVSGVSLDIGVPLEAGGDSARLMYDLRNYAPTVHSRDRTNSVYRPFVLLAAEFLVSPGAFGYGAGAGGVVVQPTNKMTAVSLNKPCGVIETAITEIAAGGTVSFTLYNNLINAAGNIGDILIANVFNSASHKVEVLGIFVGGATLRLTNISTTNKAESVKIAFGLIKGSAA